MPVGRYFRTTSGDQILYRKAIETHESLKEIYTIVCTSYKVGKRVRWGRRGQWPLLWMASKTYKTYGNVTHMHGLWNFDGWISFRQSVKIYPNPLYCYGQIECVCSGLLIWSVGAYENWTLWTVKQRYYGWWKVDVRLWPINKELEHKKILISASLKSKKDVQIKSKNSVNFFFFMPKTWPM